MDKVYLVQVASSALIITHCIIMERGHMPVFFMHNQLFPDRSQEDEWLKPYEVCTAAGRIIGRQNIDDA